MKFRLISRQGVDEGTGEIADPFAGLLDVLVWAGRTFVASNRDADHGQWIFREVLGQALDHHQVTPPPKVAERWTSPTAIGRTVHQADSVSTFTVGGTSSSAADDMVDVVDSVTPGYVVDLREHSATEATPYSQQPVPGGDPSIAALVGQPRRRRGEPS